MGIADRDYMRERVESRGGVFRPGTRHANPTRQGIVKALAVAVIGVAAAAGYHHIQADRSPPPMRPAANMPAYPALTPPAATAPVAAEGPVQEFPASGTTQWFRPTDPRQQTGILRIMDTSDMRGNKVVRIRDAFGTPVAQTYIRDEEGAQLVLPIGRYEMTIGSGPAWYGPDRQFGAGATYFQTSGADVIAGEMNYRILPGNQGGNPLTPIQPDAF